MHMKLDKSLNKKRLSLKKKSNSKEYCFNHHFILSSDIYVLNNMDKF